MFNFIKSLFKKEYISQPTLNHSSLGEYKNNRLKSGGHGQEAIDYMDKNNIKYNINTTYCNGVRVGNVPNHHNKFKRTGNNQSWFPKHWDKEDIKRAGITVARGIKYQDGKTKTGRHKNVDIGIIRTNGRVATIFPLSKQKSRRK